MSSAQSAPLPPLFKGHWFYGHLHDRIERPLGLFTELRDFSPVAELKLLVFPAYAITHPEGIRHVLVDGANKYKKGRAFHPLKPLLGGGLFIAEGAPWKKNRRLMQPSFHRERIARLAATMVDATAKRMDRWEGAVRTGSALDMHGEMMELTMSVVARCLFSSDVADAANELHEVMNFLSVEMHDRSRSMNPLKTVLPTESNRQFKKAVAALDRVIYGFIAERRARPEQAEDLLDMLIAARDEATGETLSDVELRDEMITMFLAGHETSANALAWAFHLLATHPEVAARARAEIAEHLGTRTPGSADLPKLKYLARVLEESLRLYPPGWIQARETIEEDVVMGYRLKKGRMVLLCNYVVQRDPRFWDHPDTFDPDRFLPERAQGRPRGATIPFGMGQRMCIGSNFAQMEAMLILTMALQRFELELATDMPVEPEALITLRPKGGVPMRLHSRLGTELAAPAMTG